MSVITPSTDFATFDTDDISEGSSNLYFTSERVDDRVNGLLQAGANITLTYDDTANTLTIAATEDNLSNNTTDDLSEGSTNLYYSDARVANWFTNTGLGLLSTDVIAEGSSNLYHTNARAISAVEGEATLNLQEGVTVDTDITIGNWNYRNNTNFPVTGIKVTSPEDKVKWAMINLEEFGGDLADADDKPFNIHNPTISGVVHGGTEASPTAVGSDIRTMAVAGSPRFDTGGGDVDTTAMIIFSTTEAQSSTNRGAQMLFKVCPTTRNSMEDWLKVTATALTNLNVAYDPSGSFQQTVLSTQSTNGFQVDDKLKVDDNLEVTGAQIDFTALPTSDPGVVGRLYRDGATVKVSI